MFLTFFRKKMAASDFDHVSLRGSGLHLFVVPSGKSDNTICRNHQEISLQKQNFSACKQIQTLKKLKLFRNHEIRKHSNFKRVCWCM